jgi:hypothetical protein
MSRIGLGTRANPEDTEFSRHIERDSSLQLVSVMASTCARLAQLFDARRANAAQSRRGSFTGGDGPVDRAQTGFKATRRADGGSK